MAHVRGLVTKFVMLTVVLFIVLRFIYGVSTSDILWTSVVMTIVSYIIGDLLILRRTGNTIATIADFCLAFIGIWALGSYLYRSLFRKPVPPLFLPLPSPRANGFITITYKNKCLKAKQLLDGGEAQ